MDTFNVYGPMSQGARGGYWYFITFTMVMSYDV